MRKMIGFIKIALGIMITNDVFQLDCWDDPFDFWGKNLDLFFICKHAYE